jgi:hypothetical protein
MIPWVVIDRRHFTQSRLCEGLRHSTPISSSQRLCVRLISRLSLKSLPHNLFADPHPVTPIASIFYKKSGGRRGTSKFGTLFLLPRRARKSNQIISFANPHPLTTLESYRFRNTGGALLHSRISDLPKSFICHTYGPSRKCCKHRAYNGAKCFRCNTYKKQGGWGCYG